MSLDGHFVCLVVVVLVALLYGYFCFVTFFSV